MDPLKYFKKPKSKEYGDNYDLIFCKTDEKENNKTETRGSGTADNND